MKTRTVKWPIKAWFFIHALLILSWSIPKAPPPLSPRTLWGVPDSVLQRTPEPSGIYSFYVMNDKYLRNSPIGYYLFSTGVWQYWDMFAPNPSNLDCYLEYQVIYQDGSVENKNFYRIYDMNLVDKYLHERFRKYVERIIPESSNYLWAPLAERLAYDAYKRTKKLPNRVTLRLHSRTLEFQKPKKEFRTVEFFQLVVTPKALEKFGTL